MPGWSYSVSGGGITVVNAVVTLVFINPIASPNVGVRLVRGWVSQSQNATSAQQRVQMETQVTAFPTLTSATPAKLARSSAASVITGGTAGAAGTAGINASAEGAGSKTVIFDDAFNVLNGWLWVPTPAEVIELTAGFASGVGLYFPVAVTGGQTANWNFGLNYCEY